MKRFTLLALMTGCATGEPKPQMESCTVVATPTRDIQVCGFPLGIVCFTTDEGGISCVKVPLTNKT